MSQIPRILIGDKSVDKSTIVYFSEDQSHYLTRVLRLKEGQQVKLLGDAGEWLADITHSDKKQASARAIKQLRSYAQPPDIWLLAAPVKNDAFTAMVRHAIELGARTIWPVRTAFTQTSRVNAERLRANIMEATEQCSRMDLAELFEYSALAEALAGWDEERTLLYGDESGEAVPILDTLKGLKKGQKLAILVGPEGGFSEEERAMLKTLPFVKPITLGPRILRAETAALTCLAIVQASLGDGDEKPHFVATT